MKTFSCRASAYSVAGVFSAALLQAHPGHDGHDLTWDFSHLAQHPFATLGCAAAGVAVIGVMLQLIRRPGVRRAQSLRGSQPIRGK